MNYIINKITDIKDIPRLWISKYKKWSGAVAMVIVDDSIVLIKRSNSMPSHAGQLGFFGGHKKENEVSPLETSLREFQEESGLDSSMLEFISYIEPVYTSGRKIIVPVLFRCKLSQKDFGDNIISNGEWDNFVFIKIESLMNKKLWKKAKLISDIEHNMYFFPLIAANSSFYKELSKEENPILWGASAKMILNLFKYHTDFDKNSEN